MGRVLPAEQIFSENLDRLLKGQEIRNVPESEQDLKTALDFASLMKLRRPQPKPQFQADLKARLLQKLSGQEIETHPDWFHRLIPRQPIWQALSVLAVILVIGGVLVGLLLRDNPPAPVVNAPIMTTPAMTGAAPSATTAAPKTTSPPTTTAAATTAATATMAPASTTAATATRTPATTAPAASVIPPATVPPGLQGVMLTAEGSTDKLVYAPGEKVLIEVKLKNSGAQPLILAQFPPILSLMSAAGNPVLSFHAGQNGRTLAAGESISFSQEWDQKDAKTRIVPSGFYYLELEDIDLQGQAYKLKLSQPVVFEITY
jgi:hypothetical protein